MYFLHLGEFLGKDGESNNEVTRNFQLGTMARERRTLVA